MEIAFAEKAIPCLQEQAVEVICQEETAETIVPDSCPDVTAVADSSAVCCLRSREMQSGSFSASGAFQATVLCTAEGEQGLRKLEVYLPFSVRLMGDEIRPESVGTVELRLRSVEARLLNSRKLHVRVAYAARMTVYGQGTVTVCAAEPEEAVQLLRQRETTMLPVAYAEKQTSFTETVELPAGAGELLRTTACLQLGEAAPADDRAVVKGAVLLHLLFSREGGEPGTFDVQLPVSQFLDVPDLPEDGELRPVGAISEFRAEEDADGSCLVTVGLLLQVVGWKQTELEVITDGYCVGGSFSAEYAELCLREPLDHPAQICAASLPLRGRVQKLVDSEVLVDFPVCRRSGGELTITAPVTLSALYYAESGALCGETVRGEASCTLALHEDAVCLADAAESGSCYPAKNGAETALNCSVTLSARCFAERRVRAMQSAETGEPAEAEKDRPSLLVRRMLEEDSLWNLAKRCGTTVRAIREANGLEGETAGGAQLLLIPLA